MPPKYVPYMCPRCSYETSNKELIKKHFLRKTVCPNNVGLELTDEIKKIVLRDRRYHLPKRDDRPNMVINNYNMMANFINGMDTKEKMSYLLEYCKGKYSP